MEVAHSRGNQFMEKRSIPSGVDRAMSVLSSVVSSWCAEWGELEIFSGKAASTQGGLAVWIQQCH